MRQGTSEDLTEFIFYWPSSAGHEAYPQEQFCFPSGILLEETKLLLSSGYQLEIASRLRIGA